MCRNEGSDTGKRIDVHGQDSQSSTPGFTSPKTCRQPHLLDADSQRLIRGRVTCMKRKDDVWRHWRLEVQDRRSVEFRLVWKHAQLLAVWAGMMRVGSFETLKSYTYLFWSSHSICISARRPLGTGYRGKLLIPHQRCQLTSTRSIVSSERRSYPHQGCAREARGHD